MAKRAPYFAELHIPNDLVTIESEVRLWRSVIDQAISDFMSTNKARESLSNKERAKIWLRGKTEDFSIVCEYAFLNPQHVRNEVFNIIGGIDELYK
jgi:hypothetical protein